MRPSNPTCLGNWVCRGQEPITAEVKEESVTSVGFEPTTSGVDQRSNRLSHVINRELVVGIKVFNRGNDIFNNYYKLCESRSTHDRIEMELIIFLGVPMIYLKFVLSPVLPLFLRFVHGFVVKQNLIKE